MNNERIARDAARSLKNGRLFPFDAPDKWWRSDGKNPPKADDWAHAAARGVMADLEDRAGIKHALSGIDEEARADIVANLAAIVRLAGCER